jgi:hypothetical protein
MLSSLNLLQHLKTDVSSDEMNQQTLLDGAPGPSPWYLREDKPPLPGYRWKSAGSGASYAGKTFLKRDNDVVAILDFENYVTVLDQSTLLIRSQSAKLSEPTPPVNFNLVEPNSLKSLNENLEEICRSMKLSNQRLILGGGSVETFSLDTTRIEIGIGGSFPQQIEAVEEILLFCSSSAIGLADGWNRANLALMIAKPKSSTFSLYPQDWFNTGSFDYGYQWATRVVRDPVTGLIHGDGIRIGSFVLDNSLRNLRK